MRALLDENLPRGLKQLLAAEVEVVTVRERGWGSKENGELLELAQHEFDAVITTDQGIPHQQDLSRFVPSSLEGHGQHVKPIYLALRHHEKMDRKQIFLKKALTNDLTKY